MTTDLKSKSFEELRREVYITLQEGYHSDGVLKPVDELARRLEEEQLAERDATLSQVAALAKAEVLEEVLEGMDDGDILDHGWLRELAAEYRAKAGKKE